MTIEELQIKSDQAWIEYQKLKSAAEPFLEKWASLYYELNRRKKREEIRAELLKEMESQNAT